MNRKEIEDLIINVFNYFNGKINLFQRARLIINWCERPNDPRGGLTTNPNCVTIFPATICRYSGNITNIKINIILIIIHELYHVDQCINFQRLEVDTEYRRVIESTVEVQSMTYLYNHFNEINNLFGVNMTLKETALNELIPVYTTGNLYHRQRYLDHLLSLISDMFSHQYYVENNIESLVAQYYNVYNTTIDIEINDVLFIVKENDYLANVNYLNDFFYENYSKYNYIAHSEGDIYGEDNKLHIIINAELRNYVAGQVK